jgi:hypothetical protein
MLVGEAIAAANEDFPQRNVWRGHDDLLDNYSSRRMG